MYKILVIDDEPIVRLAIRSLVDWNKYGYVIEAEESNGRLGLDSFSKNPTDIIIVDINMPIMNGLDFIRELHKYPNFPCVVVLSAYNDYNLVREAFKLGASDYILKSDMNGENLIKVINSLDIKTISEESQNNKYLKEAVIRELLFGQKTNLEIENIIIPLNLKFHSKNLMVIYILVDDYYNVCKRYDENSLKEFMEVVNNVLIQILSKLNRGEAVIVSPDEYAIIFSFEECSKATIIDLQNQLLLDIRYNLKNYVNIGVTIGVSSIRNDFSFISILYKEAVKNARYRYYNGKGKNIFPSDVKMFNNVPCNVATEQKKLISALNYLDKDKIFNELDIIFKKMRTYLPEILEEKHLYYVEILYLIKNYISSINEELFEVLGVKENLERNIAELETEEEIIKWITDLVKELVVFLENREEMKFTRNILSAIKFIKQNYKSNISLKMVADQVELSESYFSFSFSKQIGESFSDFLTKIRIEKAKELILNTNLKMYEICENVGYNHEEHFSRIFKKFTGYSPNNFKKNMLN